MKQKHTTPNALLPTVPLALRFLASQQFPVANDYGGVDDNDSVVYDAMTHVSISSTFVIIVVVIVNVVIVFVVVDMLADVVDLVSVVVVVVSVEMPVLDLHLDAVSDVRLYVDKKSAYSFYRFLQLVGTWVKWLSVWY